MRYFVAVITCLALGTFALAQEESSWHSPSLTDETVTGSNGAITTRTALEADARWGIKGGRRAEKVVEGVYALRGWGIAHTFAIDAPDGWIIIDTGDSTQAAAEMRKALEEMLGRKIDVAAILLTHWHYAEGTGAWLDDGTEIWGHEFLDRNRSAATGVSIMSGFFVSRAIAQFGVFHPRQGPDAFPNSLGFGPERFLAESSYQPPTRLFEDGKVLDLVIAGEQVQVAPNRSDTTDSVGFYFPRHRALVTNFMAPGGIFNIYTLRGGSFRNPVNFINDARWLEAKNAEVLLDIHAGGILGQELVREAIERSVDQVQLIHDQTLRKMAKGKNPREAAENIYIPDQLRAGWENYGQVESHVRQVYNGNAGWFGGDVYDINPLSLREEAARTLEMMGGREAVRKVAAAANDEGGLANWRWSLKLTSLLRRTDPTDTEAQKVRAAAARALGQRTTSANARGFYLTEALQLEGKLLVEEQPQTLDAIRKFAGTPSGEKLAAVSVDENLQFVRYLVDPRKAEGKRLAFTIAIEGEPQLKRIELRNGVLVIIDAGSKAAVHVDVTRRELAEFVLGSRMPTNGRDALVELDRVLDRSQLLDPSTLVPDVMKQKEKTKYNSTLEH